MLWSREAEKTRLPGFNRAVHLLKEVAKSELLYHKALSWAYLGIYLDRFYYCCGIVFCYSVYTCSLQQCVS